MTFPSNLLPYQEYLCLVSLDVHQTNQPHHESWLFLKESNVGANFEGPTLHLCCSTWFLLLWLPRNLLQSPLCEFFSKHQPDCRTIWRTIEKSNNNLHCLSWVSYFAASNIICNFTSLQLFVLSKNVDQPSEQRVRYLRLMLKHADNSTTFKCSSIRIDVKARSGQFHHYQISSLFSQLCLCDFSPPLRLFFASSDCSFKYPPFNHKICTVNSVRLSNSVRLMQKHHKQASLFWHYFRKNEEHM